MLRVGFWVCISIGGAGRHHYQGPNCRADGREVRLRSELKVPLTLQVCPYSQLTISRLSGHFFRHPGVLIEEGLPLFVEFAKSHLAVI